MKGSGWCSSVWGLGRTGGGTSSGTSQSLAPKGRPDLLRMGVVIFTDMRIGELAVEGFLWGEFGLSEAIPGVHILVRVNTLSH